MLPDHAPAPHPMHIQDVFQHTRQTFSFEFFPPKSADAASELFAAVKELEPLAPTFVSVTYGAGGTTRELTTVLVVRLKQETPLNPVPHLTCVAHTEPEIDRILARYAQAGISNILALRGDLPKGMTESEGFSSFPTAASLVRHIRKFGEKGNHPDRRGFGIGIAGYPEGHPATPNRLLEIDYLKAKADEGASYIITQLFFENRDFLDFRARCEFAGIRIPIIAGIMPITSIQGMKRMADLAAGARIPAPLLRAIGRTGGDAEAVRRVGVHWATEQCRDLLEHNVAGIHLYTLNKSTATREIYATLGVKDSSGLRG